MIFIWSNDGGPLQYVGLCLFALQFLLPQLTNVYNLTMEIQYTHNIPLAAVSMTFLVVVIAIFGVVVWMNNFNVIGDNYDDTTTTGNDTNISTFFKFFF